MKLFLDTRIIMFSLELLIYSFFSLSLSLSPFSSVHISARAEEVVATIVEIVAIAA